MFQEPVFDIVYQLALQTNTSIAFIRLLQIQKPWRVLSPALLQNSLPTLLKNTSMILLTPGLSFSDASRGSLHSCVHLLSLEYAHAWLAALIPLSKGKSYALVFTLLGFLSLHIMQAPSPKVDEARGYCSLPKPKAS